MSQPVWLFSYGTLRLPEVQHATFGRLVPGVPDAVVGHRVVTVSIADPEVVATSGLATHPALVHTGDPTDVVPGVRFELTEADLAAADRYEVQEYARVELPLLSGLTAWVYVVVDVGHHADGGAADGDRSGPDPPRTRS